MSRKRGKDKRPADAVPEEVLAEGSGPNEVVDADARTLADVAAAALETVVEDEGASKKRGRKRKAVHDQAAAEAAEAVGAVTGVVDSVTVVEEDGDLADVVAAEEAAAAAEDEALEAAVAEEPTTADLEAQEPAQALEDMMLRAEADADLAPSHDALEGDEDEDDEEAGAALPTSAATMEPAQFKSLVEALVFASDKPVTLQRLRQLTRVSDQARIEAALEELAQDYAPRGIALQIVSGGYQFRTNTQFSVWVQQLIAGRPVRLSRAQLETLAVVAYRQPITRPEIDDIRGVDSSATLRLLMDRQLIRILGKKEDVGRPMLYGTTRDFLDFFSLNDLRELPTLREYSELTAESRKVMSDELGIPDPGPNDIEGADSVMSDESIAAAMEAMEASEASEPTDATDATEERAAADELMADAEQPDEPMAEAMAEASDAGTTDEEPADSDAASWPAGHVRAADDAEQEGIREAIYERRAREVDSSEDAATDESGDDPAVIDASSADTLDASDDPPAE